ncbi:MAG TPA: DUF1460 domain-containing protein [Phycisphaerae bacterium]|nr:DUF1460 domain-containing protein [Phycisphaerae bacterium]
MNRTTFQSFLVLGISLNVSVAVTHAQSESMNSIENTHRKLASQFATSNFAIDLRDSTIGDRAALFAKSLRGMEFQMGADMFDLRRVDCVTFTERCLALACADDWDQYYVASQRLRHGAPSNHFLDRNFFTLTDWVPNNAWLLDDMTSTLGCPVTMFDYVVRPRQFFERLEFGEDDSALGREKAAAKAARIALLPEKITHRDHYVSRSDLAQIETEIHAGDVLLVIRERNLPGMVPWYDSDHMGVAVRDRWVAVHSACSSSSIGN